MKEHIYTLLISFFLIAAAVVVIFKFTNSKKEISNEISKIDSEIQSKWKTRELIYPNELIPINTEKKFNEFIETKDSLFINYLDADCSVCVDDLTLWRKYLKNNNKKAIFIISGSEQLKVDYMINNALSFKHPVFYDEYDGFNQLNELSSYKSYHSFQLKDKKIINVGSPILLENFK